MEQRILNPKEQQELLALSREQIRSVNWTEEKRARILELRAKLEPRKLTPNEQQELLALSRDQYSIESTNWTEDKRKRILELRAIRGT